MMLKSIQVKNFHSIRDETLSCDSRTALIGANGAGKSSFLSALAAFKNEGSGIIVDDFYNRDVSVPIRISLVFKDLNCNALRLFSPYIRNGELRVEQITHWTDGRADSKIHGKILQNPDFDIIREGDASAAKAEYRRLRVEKYRDLPSLTTHKDMKKAVEEWEAEHPTSCKLVSDNGRFFNFNKNTEGSISKFINFLHIPAVHDASIDSTEGRMSALTGLVELMVRNKLAGNKEIEELKEAYIEKYRDVMNTPMLPKLKGELEKTLQMFAPNSSLSLDWEESGFEVGLPSARIYLGEDGYKTAVQRSGHGLQRTFIMTMLQHLSKAQTDDVKNDQGVVHDPPNTVLTIDEPELYQHPSRQRHMAEIFRDLTGDGPGTPTNMQIIYSTHSPYFIGADEIDKIRVLRKTEAAKGEPKATKVYRTSFDIIAERSATNHKDRRFKNEEIKAILQMIMTPWVNEGFFANTVVLVEGDSDRSAILAVAKICGHDFDGMGISIVPCGGKENLDKPAIIFDELGIKTYVVWDADNEADEKNNKINDVLLRLVNGDIAGIESHAVKDNFACFRSKMEDMLTEEIKGFVGYRKDCTVGFIKSSDQLNRKPGIVSMTIKRAYDDNQSCRTLESVVEKIVELNNGAAPKKPER